MIVSTCEMVLKRLFISDTGEGLALNIHGSHLHGCRASVWRFYMEDGLKLQAVWF